ncbi:MAG: AbrB/MazE/SpoVT family DNA-binding domain-containing protein [Chthoniobacterales bacterium]|nr:AbrB/MazE/SpoVT family DNA-binding domain-containing protein [Chthoniobacterales bacterium]
MTTTISSKGQITVPVGIREAIGLVPGTRLELELGPGATFVARKASKESHFAKFRAMAKDRGLGGSKAAMKALRGTVERGEVDA